MGCTSFMVGGSDGARVVRFGLFVTPRRDEGGQEPEYELPAAGGIDSEQWR